jgi:hypothetical protein
MFYFFSRNLNEFCWLFKVMLTLITKILSLLDLAKFSIHNGKRLFDGENCSINCFYCNFSSFISRVWNKNESLFINEMKHYNVLFSVLNPISGDHIQSLLLSVHISQLLNLYGRTAQVNYYCSIGTFFVCLKKVSRNILFV